MKLIFIRNSFINPGEGVESVTNLGGSTDISAEKYPKFIKISGPAPFKEIR